MSARLEIAWFARGATETARSALAFGALALGATGTAAIVPLILWGLAERGFH